MHKKQLFGSSVDLCLFRSDKFVLRSSFVFMRSDCARTVSRNKSCQNPVPAQNELGVLDICRLPLVLTFNLRGLIYFRSLALVVAYENKGVCHTLNILFVVLPRIIPSEYLLASYLV